MALIFLLVIKNKIYLTVPADTDFFIYSAFSESKKNFIDLNLSRSVHHRTT